MLFKVRIFAGTQSPHTIYYSASFQTSPGMLNTLKWEQRWVVIMPTTVHIYKVRRLRVFYSLLKQRHYSASSDLQNQTPAHGTQPNQVVELGMDAVVEDLAPRQVRRHAIAL